LDRLTAADNPDFLVLCSSLTALTGGPGQGDYTAANCYLDAFSFYRDARGRKTLTINWTAWKEVGMAAAFGPVEEEDFFAPISPGDAVQAFHQVLHKKTSRVFIGGLDLQRVEADSIDSLPFKISPALRREMETQPGRTDGAGDTGAANKEISYETVILKGKGEARENYSETEIKIASTWSYALGLEEIDIYDNFYDMGGDSIIALTIVNYINREPGTDVTVADLFNHLTVEELARFIQEPGTGKKEITKPGDKEQFSLIKPVRKKRYYPVSAAQKRLFILNRLDSRSTGYNLPDAHIIEGNLDIKKLEDAFTRLIDRHETLRTSFALIDGEPVQGVHEENYTIQIAKYKQNTTEAGQRIKDFIRPFDLSQVPLLRVELIECPGNKFILFMDIHHIAADAFSCEILINELMVLYSGRDLPGLTIQYKDFAAWQNDRFQSGKLDRQKSYWLESLKGTIPVLALPVDFPRPRVQSFAGDLVTVLLDEAMTDRVKSFARENRSTLYMILLSVYYILLHRWTGQEDIIIGSAVLGRPHPDLEKLVGMFVNVLAMRNFPGSNKTGREFLAEIKTSVLNAFENQDYPFDELVEELDIRRDLGRSPLTDVEFSFMSFDKPAGKRENKTAGINIYPYEGAQKKSSKTDIALFCTEGKQLAFMFEYCTALFKRETMERKSSGSI
jgi:acyl carrier protein